MDSKGGQRGSRETKKEKEEMGLIEKRDQDKGPICVCVCVCVCMDVDECVYRVEVCMRMCCD
jgi:hypothetical protein